MKNNILLLTYHSTSAGSDYHELMIHTGPRFTKYAHFNNYDYKHDVIDTSDPGICRLQKLNVINQQLQYDYQYIIYSDIDIFIKDTTYDIFNESQNTPGRRYHSLYKDITISKDFNGLCAGFMIVKNTKFSKQFFNTCEFLKPTTISELPKSQQSPGDQELIKHLYCEYPNVRKNIDPDLSEKIVSNNRSSELTKKKSFAHHFWWRNRSRDAIKDAIIYMETYEK